MKKTLVVLSIIFSIFAVLLLVAFGYFFTVTKGVALDSEKLTLDTSCVRIFDCDGAPVEESRTRENASFSKMPAHLPSAFVAVEDKRFFSHNGFDYKRIGKAILQNIRSLSFREGASTISQQLIKNTHLSGEKTLSRKLKEWKLTHELEKKYSKEKILECYLNSIYFGHNAFGVVQASRFYFDEEVENLTPAKSATLACLVKSPNRYSPFKQPEKCLKRRNFVLSLMKEQGFLSQTEYETAKKEPLPQPKAHVLSGGAYLSKVYEELAEIFPDARTQEMGTLRVYTFFEPKLQKKLEDFSLDCDGIFLVRDNQTHGVKALRSTLGTPNRLPASTIKPLLVYAPALEENLISPATPVLDEKIDFSGYSPSNYGGTYGGYMSARYALSHSVNVPAVKILNELGVEKGCKYLKKLGLYVPNEDESLALALGGMREGFSLPALLDGYSTFANGGEFCHSQTIARVENGDGQTLYSFRPKKARVFREEVCFLINDMLCETAQTGTAKRLKSLPFPVCAKTGTGANSFGNTDAYTIAYTAQDCVGVWLGNADNSPVNATGGGLPCNYALSILQTLYENSAPKALFAPNDKVKKVSFDRLEYEKNHRILCADALSPAGESISDYFLTDNLPKQTSERFSRPTVQKPRIWVENHTVCIELCQTYYYEYVLKRENDGKITTIYEGNYTPVIYDTSVSSGKSYVYTLIPYYRGRAGTPVTLPSVRIDASKNLPDGWWE